MRIGIYAGSFDPITNGHLDVIKRSMKLVDRLVIGVLCNPSKNGMFTPDEKVKMIQRVIVENDLQECDIKVEAFEGLLVEFANKMNANINIRGVRTCKDYEYEMEMALINKKLNSKMETVMLMADSSYAQISSSMVKEIALFRGDVSCFVPECIKEELENKLSR